MYREDAKEDRSLLIAALNPEVHAIDRNTGEVRWRSDLGGADAQLLVAEGRVFVFTRPDSLVVLDYGSGNLVKHVQLPFEYSTRLSMLLDQGQLFLTTGGALACTSLDGDLLWHARLGHLDVTLALPNNARQVEWGAT